MKKRLQNIVFFYLVLLKAVTGFSQTIVINEIQYSNKNTIEDSYGETPDWIELYNYGSQPIDLEGMRLTDDISDTDSWYFPDYTIEGGEFLIVFASGRDVVSNGEIHSDFKIKQLVDTVFLINSNGETISSVEPVCCPVDLSLGRLGDSSDYYSVITPSPGKSNSLSTEKVVFSQPDSLSIDIPAGFYDSALTIHLKKNIEDNVIYYSLDGTDPDEGSLIYTESVRLYDKNGEENVYASISTSDSWIEPGNKILKGNVLKAVVYSDGCPASNVIANTYFIGEEFLSENDVPVVSIISDPDNFFDDDEGIYVQGNNNNYLKKGKKWERPAHFEMFDTNRNIVVEQNIGVRIHGRGSRAEPQKSLRIYAREEYGKETIDYPFFGQKDINSFTTLLLSAEKTNSPVIFKDELCHSLVKDMNMDYQAWCTVTVYLNGEYWGIHNIREYQDIDYIKNNYNLTSDSYDIISYSKSGGPEVSEGDILAYNELFTTIENTDMSADDAFDLIDSLVDVDNMIDYYIAQLYFANVDFPDNNYAMWRCKEENSKWRWFLFDCEAGMQYIDNENILEYMGVPDFLQTSPDYSIELFSKILENEEFQKQFVSKFYYHMNKTFRSDIVLNKIQEFEEDFAPLMPEHIYRWNQPATLSKWYKNISSLESFALQRPVSVYSQLNELFGNPFIIYPNPSSGQFLISFDSEIEGGSVLIYDSYGSLVGEYNDINGQEFDINSDFKNGVYILRVKIDNSVFKDKLIIQ